jgi:hypothetical protein
MPTLTDLETFGRRLAAAQGYAGDDVDFIAYGSAAHRALRKRGGAVPEPGEFRSNAPGRAAPFGLRLGPCPTCGAPISAPEAGAIAPARAPMPPPLTNPSVVVEPIWVAAGFGTAIVGSSQASQGAEARSLTSNAIARSGRWSSSAVAKRPTPRPGREVAAIGVSRDPESARQVVEAVRAKILTPDDARAWFGVSLPHKRRVLSGGWILRVGLGTVWRVALFGVVMALGASGFVPSLAQLGALAIVLVGPGIFWTPWRSVWRWSAASTAVAYVLAPTPLFADGVVVLLASTVPAGALAARRWRLAG